MDGRKFATDDQVKKCLKDAKTAGRYAEAVKASAAATARANAESGRRLEVESQLVKERTTSDDRLVKVVQLTQKVATLESRWKPWVVVVVGVAAFALGSVVGYGVGKVLP